MKASDQTALMTSISAFVCCMHAWTNFRSMTFALAIDPDTSSIRVAGINI